VITLEAVGLASLAFVAVFTWRTYSSGPDPRAAILEAWANICLGFSFNLLANFILLPLVGVHPSLSANFWLGWPYTVVSLVRQYAIRRWFAERVHRAAKALAR
jgi:hypothetical protein